MAEPAGPFHLLQAGPGRYLCYCRPGPGPGGTVYVTDALEVWAGELGGGPPLDCRCPPEEHGAKLREALGRGAAALSLGEGKATLQLREEARCSARCSALELFKLPIAEARSQVQALVFGMAGRVESLERRLEAVEMLTSSYSPEKNVARSQQLFLPGKQLPGGNLPWCRCLFAFSSLGGCRSCVHVLSRTLGVSLAVAAVSHPATPAPFLAQKGPGLLGCLGCSVLRWDAGHCQAGCSPASRRRSGFAALPDRGPWQVRGSLLLWERRRGLALPHPPQMLGQPGWAAGG
ncbi:protein PAXX isoform X2 [Chroicocephalus ridibundus]|uniref:protein PAXX isoform X2 n=1 Tax=Chroicocephalus ridibundus TaxID=1192867 RepID=UPI002FDD93AE